MIETIFYFLGSIFFFLSISVLAVIVVFSIKILQRIVRIETEIENTVTEAKNTVAEVKNKVSAFSIGIAGIVALLEELINLKNRRDHNRRDKDEGAPAKKKQKKFAQDDSLE
jgi:Na+-transporting methylmalonyl-CoA/oxaloacetate decarboxylase gamma subunit